MNEHLLTPTVFSAAISSAATQLEVARTALEKLACPQITCLRVNLSDLSEEKIGELLEAVPTGYGKTDKTSDYVYVVQLSSEPQLTAALSEQLHEARKSANDYSRLNPENSKSPTLYVGRSKTLRTRLKQHLGADGRGVYSLHLQRWATGNDAELTISLMQFNNAEDLLVQAVEDGLWSSLRPAFGRKGER